MSNRNADIDRHGLNYVMEFDHVVQVHADGTVTDAAGVYAPELYGEDAQSGWTLLDGYSNQYGYSGPHLHASEFIGGGLERDILATPGFYVALVAYDLDDDERDEPTGWAVAYRESL